MSRVLRSQKISWAFSEPSLGALVGHFPQSPLQQGPEASSAAPSWTVVRPFQSSIVWTDLPRGPIDVLNDPH